MKLAIIKISPDILRETNILVYTKMYPNLKSKIQFHFLMQENNAKLEQFKIFTRFLVLQCSISANNIYMYQENFIWN